MTIPQGSTPHFLFRLRYNARSPLLHAKHDSDDSTLIVRVYSHGTCIINEDEDEDEGQLCRGGGGGIYGLSGAVLSKKVGKNMKKEERARVEWGVIERGGRV